MKITITEIKSDDFQTLSNLVVTDENCKEVFKCYCLELPEKGNKRRESRIPAGEYKTVKRNSPKYKNHFHLLDVPNRDMILIHHGNYKKDTLGCILPGKDLIDIDGDGHKDVTNSIVTMNHLNKILPNEFFTEIKRK